MSEFDQKAKEWDKNQMHLYRTMAVASQLMIMIPFKPNMKALEFFGLSFPGFDIESSDIGYGL